MFPWVCACVASTPPDCVSTALFVSGEWYEDESGLLHTCEGFEDADCADRWYYTSIDDHMHYLGLPIGEYAVWVHSAQ